MVDYNLFKTDLAKRNCLEDADILCSWVVIGREHETLVTPAIPLADSL